MSKRGEIYRRPFGFALSCSGSDDADRSQQVFDVSVDDESDGGSVATCVGDIAPISDFEPCPSKSSFRDCSVIRRGVAVNVQFDEDPVTDELEPSKDVEYAIRANERYGIWVKARLPILRKFVRGARSDCREQKKELDSFGYPYPFVSFNYSQTLKNCVANMRGYQSARSSRQLSGEIVIEPLRRRALTCKKLTRTFVLSDERAAIKAEAAAYVEEVEW